jgi:glycosyltransferase 2 family protein
MRLKFVFNLLFYCSLIFLLIYLLKNDFLIVPKIVNYTYLILSFTFLVLGIILQCLNWKYVLNIFHIQTSFRYAIISIGLSVFMKYIPGKVMILLGRASYISDRTCTSLPVTSSVSLFDQVLSLWGALLIGSVLLFGSDVSYELKFVAIITFVVLTTALLFPVIVERILKWILVFFKKQIEFPRIKFSSVVKLIPYFIFVWVLWGIGFYSLILSLYDSQVPYMLSLAFPLAGSLAIVAIFAPGGLGVREGLLVSCLLLYKIPLPEATVIALSSRLWFLIGEVFVFFVAIILNRKVQKI